MEAGSRHGISGSEETLFLFSLGGEWASACLLIALSPDLTVKQCATQMPLLDWAHVELLQQAGSQPPVS